MNKQARVVDLAGTREMLADWDQVRRYIIAGKLKGWAFGFVDYNDRHGVELGGLLKTDRAKALRALMRISVELNKGSDPPEFRDSRQ